MAFHGTARARGQEASNATSFISKLDPLTQSVQNPGIMECCCMDERFLVVYTNCLSSANVLNPFHPRANNPYPGTPNLGQA
jgi:hypothetical protein